jgi:Asp-tRNA(Asn)/Glu-tRNA(Gln) amidotransferase A subunit family amidase
VQSKGNYSHESFSPLTFHDAVTSFMEKKDTPRAYLERCLAEIDAREAVVQAWVSMNIEGARAAADESSARYKAGRALSRIDGMPIGVKDLIQTKDMPTTLGSPIFSGNITKNDSASIQALRSAGAIVLGKTVTTEFGMSQPGPTTNPFDQRRTPGGSSSGSAAVIGAKMVPVAIGSQLLASIIRPAGYCANIAIKPTLGALNRGERLGNSHSHLGIHAGSLKDMWHVAREIANRVGGDPGYPGLFGADELSAPIKPSRLILLETEAWKQVGPKTLDALDTLLKRLTDAGVEILRRSSHRFIEMFEQTISDNMAMCRDMIGYENRWNFENLYARFPDKLSDSIIVRLKRSRSLTLDDYRVLLSRREDARRHFAALGPLADGIIALTSDGPAPVLGDTSGSAQGITHTTGTPAMAAPLSMLGAPTVALPMMAVEGMPVGVQIAGQPHFDQKVCGMARWVKENIEQVTVD